MSSVVVTTRPIVFLTSHPNADRLELAIVGAWQVVVGKGQFKVGDLVTYIPPDCVVPDELADKWGIKKHLSSGRVRAIKLRGEPSYGFVVPPEGPLDENIADKLGITKYVHPIKFSSGDCETPHPLFDKFTDIENLRHYDTVIAEGELVRVTEKIHGTNSRIALIRDEDGNWKRYAGSRTMQKKEDPNSLYWFPWSIPAVAAMMEQIVSNNATQSVILYGEIYGNVQSLKYGLEKGVGFAAFDSCKVDGKWVLTPIDDFDIPQTPILYEGPFSMAKIIELSKGRSTLPNANHIREGVVVAPLVERYDPKIGRVILKYVSDDYLCGDFDASNE